MGLRFTGRLIGSRVLRESNDVSITVTEPPTSGRPPGYAIGDVGQFTLSATVQPRSIDQGGSLSVSLKLTGTGNIPDSIRVPARTGIEWLEPEKKDSIDSVGTSVSGWRTFGYVVRVNESGTVKLGKVELPYWDPVAKRYQVASVDLGSVDVRPTMQSAAPQSNATPSDTASKTGNPFAALPSPHRDLGAYRPTARLVLDGAPFWWMLAAPPLLFVMTTVGSRALRTSRTRREIKKTSASTLAQTALADLRTAETRGDGKAVASAAERALHLGIEAATGLKSRGVLIADLGRELEGRGLEATFAARIGAALSACEALRFDPGASAASMTELGDETRAISRELAAWKADA
jgi:hypothetical protein